MKRSPLHDQHVALGAKFAEFGGWEMPLDYADSGVVTEHTAVRTNVGLFDVSHMGTVFVTGPGAADYLDATLSNSLGKIRPGKAQYTLCCEDRTGGIVDDMILYYRGDDELLIVPNAANAAEVVRRLGASAPADVRVDDRHQDYAMIAVQGPNSTAVLAELGLPTDHDYMSFVDADFAGTSVVVCRTGYTGEHGYELVAPASVATRLWQALADTTAEPRPCGLGARDTLRTEAGLPLHGNDISPEVTPVQARLGFAVGWKKPEFWGREALLAERGAGPARRLRGLVADGRGIPRPGMAVLPADRDGQQAADGDEENTVGSVTSGTFSPTLRKGIGMALLAAEIEDGDTVTVDIRGRRESFTVTKPPFVQLEPTK